MEADKGKGKEKEVVIEPPKPRSPVKDTANGNEEDRGRSHGPVPQTAKDERAVGDKPRKPEGPHGIDECRTVGEKSREHECEWREKYDNLKTEVGAQGQADEIGLEGLTIVLHMKGRDDLVINTDLRNLE